MNSQIHNSMKSAGIAMVEFAILLPFLAALFLGFVEVGRALYQKNMLTKAMTTGARYMARVPGGVTAACAPGANWAAASEEARSIVLYPLGADDELLLAGLDDPDALSMTVRPESGGGFTSCVVRIQASVPFDSLAQAPLPLLDLSSVFLNAAAEERYIGE